MEYLHSLKVCIQKIQEKNGNLQWGSLAAATLTRWLDGASPVPGCVGLMCLLIGARRMKQRFSGFLAKNAQR